jgi:hypothetical protein
MHDMTSHNRRSTVRSAPAAPAELAGTWSVHRWFDPLVDADGHDPRDPYVERYWLPLLGPSATWLVRYVADLLDQAPRGLALDTDGTARCLGVGVDALVRALTRAQRFGVARIDATGDDAAGIPVVRVRVRLPDVPHHLVGRFPAWLREAHERDRLAVQAARSAGAQPGGADPLAAAG